MSVRIHQLSKDIGMENKELIALLKSRGYEVKSASSTVDNISAEALREEFAALFICSRTSFAARPWKTHRLGATERPPRDMTTLE